MYLYGADDTTLIADCGKITEVNTENLVDLTSQTYMLSCDSSQLASYVLLEDSEDTEEAISIEMNIAEVTVYGTVPPSIGKSEDISDPLGPQQ